MTNHNHNHNHNHNKQVIGGIGIVILVIGFILLLIFVVIPHLTATPPASSPPASSPPASSLIPASLIPGVNSPTPTIPIFSTPSLPPSVVKAPLSNNGVFIPNTSTPTTNPAPSTPTIVYTLPPTDVSTGTSDGYPIYSSCPTTFVNATSTNLLNGVVLPPDSYVEINNVAYCNTSSYPITGTLSSTSTSTVKPISLPPVSTPTQTNTNVTISTPIQQPTNYLTISPTTMINATPVNLPSGVSLDPGGAVTIAGTTYVNHTINIVSNPTTITTTPAVQVPVVGSDAQLVNLYILQSVSQPINNITYPVTMTSTSKYESYPLWSPLADLPIAKVLSNNAYQSIPIYRAYNSTTGAYMDGLSITGFPYGYAVQNAGTPIYYAYGTQIAGTIPIYQVYTLNLSNQNLPLYMLTGNDQPYVYGNWTSNGVMFYAFPYYYSQTTKNTPPSFNIYYKGNSGSCLSQKSGIFSLDKCSPTNPNQLFSYNDAGQLAIANNLNNCVDMSQNPITVTDCGSTHSAILNYNSMVYDIMNGGGLIGNNPITGCINSPDGNNILQNQNCNISGSSFYIPTTVGEAFNLAVDAATAPGGQGCLRETISGGNYSSAKCNSETGYNYIFKYNQYGEIVDTNGKILLDGGYNDTYSFYNNEVVLNNAQDSSAPYQPILNYKNGLTMIPYSIGTSIGG